MSQLKRLAVAGAGMTLVIIVTAVLAASPASASATPCDGTGHRYYWTPSGGLDTTTIIYFPAHDAWEQTYGGTGFWSCSMAQGASGSPVSRLQHDLNQCYSGIIAAPLVEDGRFGTKTKAALVTVQRHHQIEANGQYGPQTAAPCLHTYYSYWHGEGCLPLEFFGWPGNTG